MKGTLFVLITILLRTTRYLGNTPALYVGK